MTEQTRENVIYNNKEYQTYSYPELSPELDEKAKSIKSGYTSSYRKYLGTWEIADQKLFLKDISIEKLKAPLFASWFTGEVILPGNIITDPNKIFIPTSSVIPNVEYPVEFTCFHFKNGVLENITVRDDCYPELTKFLKERNNRSIFKKFKEFFWEAS